MRLRSLSLKYKFIILLVGFAVLLSVSFGWVTRDRLEQELWNQFYGQGKDWANSLGAKVEEGGSGRGDTGSLVSENPLEVISKLREVLEIMTQNSLQKYAYFQLVVGGNKLWTQNIADLNETYLLLESMPTSAFEIRTLDVPGEMEIVDFKRPLPCGPSLEQPDAEASVCHGVSYLRLGLYPTQVKQELQQATLIIGLMTAGFIATGILVAFLLYKLVLGPVDVLTASVKSFRHDRYVRAYIRSGDELQTLGDEFNKMAATISDYEGHLERINQQLYSANQVKSEFLAIMGHELKTPLHAIRGFSQLLLQNVEGPLTGEQRQDVEAILGSGNHLLELIDNILRFSKLEAGEETLHIETAYADQLVLEAMNSVSSLVRGKGLALVNQTPAIPVQTDATKLKQILINLLSNAIKYTPSGTITVGAEPLEGEVRFSVADTGLGIAPEDAERVFEPFTQLDSSNTRESAGIGLGLAIVKKYVEMHGGRVWFEGVQGEGSVFHFTLPDQPVAPSENGASENGARALPAATKED